MKTQNENKQLMKTAFVELAKVVFLFASLVAILIAAILY